MQAHTELVHLRFAGSWFPRHHPFQYGPSPRLLQQTMEGFMYGNPLITPELVRHQMKETTKVYGATGPLPDAYWYEPQATQQPRWSLRKPQAVPTREEACGCEVC